MSNEIDQSTPKPRSETTVVCPVCHRSVHALVTRTGKCARCTFTTLTPAKPKPSPMQRDLDKLARELTRMMRKELR